MEIQLRWGKEADSEAVVAIARENWRVIYEGYRESLGEELYEMAYCQPLDQKEQSVRQALAEGRMFVAECAGQICGFATFRVEGTMGVLSENAVSGLFRGKGIAGMLYERIFAQLREAGCTVVSVTTGLDDAHAPARRAYEKMGFAASLSSVRYFQKL